MPIKGLTVELGGETKGLQAALKDVGRVSNDINKELGQIETGLKFDPQNTVLLAQKHELLKQKIEETKKGLDALRQAEERVEEMFKAGEIDSGQYRDFRRQIEASESKLKTFEKQVKDVEKAQKDAGKVAGEWGEKLKKGSEKAALGAGAAAGAAFTVGFLGGMDVEKATDKLAAQLGASGAEAERYGEVAGNLYAGAWGDSMEDVSGAVSAVVTSIGGMRGATASDLEDMTAKVLDFATAFEVDVPRAAQVAGQMVKSGLADNATEALDLLTVAMQNVPAAVRDDIMDAVDEYGPFLASIGIDGPQAFGLLVKGAEKGMYGIDKTGDALKEFTIRATDMSAASKVGYDLLGLSQEEMSRKLLKGGEEGAQAFDQIVDALLAIEDPVAQSQAALALFGTPLEDLSVQEIPEFLKGLDTAKDSLGDVAGATAEMGAVLNDNAATALESFKRQVQQALVEKMADALPAMQGVFTFLSQYSGVIIPVVGALAGFAGVIAAISAAMKAWAVIQVILNATLWASPITWIIVAVAALAAGAYLLIKNWDSVAAFFAGLWERVKSIFEGVPGPIQTSLAPLIAIIKQPFELGILAVKTLVALFKAVISGDFGAIPGIITGALSKVIDIMEGPFKAGYNAVKDVLAALDRATGGKLGEVVATARSVLAPVLAVMELPFKLGKIAIDTVIALIKAALKGDFGAMPGIIKDALGDVSRLLYDTGKAIMKGLLDGIKAAWTATADFLKGVGQKIKDLKGPMDKDRVLLYPEGAAIIAGLGEGMQSQIPDLLSMVSGLSGAISGSVAMSGGASRAVAAGAVSGAAMNSYTFTGPISVSGVQDVPTFMRAIEREVTLLGRARGAR